MSRNTWWGHRVPRPSKRRVWGSGDLDAFHAGPLAAMLLGMVTGIGGGIVRDVLVMEVPTVLRTELYAVAALLGAAVLVGGRRLGLSFHVAAPAGAALCIALRVMAIHSAGTCRLRALRHHRLHRARITLDAQERKSEALEAFDEGDLR